MQYHALSRPPASRPIAIEVDGEPLGVVVPADPGYRFLAVRYAAFALDGQVFGSLEEARAAIGEAVRGETARP